jgi:thermostable 8-oxoguanine DNA glycosylase
MKGNEIVIDEEFIIEYESKYDDPEIGGDEREYSELIKRVSYDVSQGNISKSTFRCILNWKAARVKGYVKWDNFKGYEDTFKQVIKMIKENPDKYLETIIRDLDKLDGIGIPIASTIVHFISPKDFPIVDKRTVQVLQKANYLDGSKKYYHYRDKIEGYKIFRREVLNIAKKYAGGDIRKVDRALFAYHKINSKTEVNQTKSELCITT